MTNSVGRSASQPGSRPSGRAARGVSPVPASIPSAGFASAKKLSIFPPPLPARVVLARALGITIDEATLGLTALIEAGYGLGPRNPTNGMFAAYIESTFPASGHQQVITAMSKAKLRWQAMLEQGTAMAMSLKYAPDDLTASAIEARRAETQGGSVEDESAVPKADAQYEPDGSDAPLRVLPQ